MAVFTNSDIKKRRELLNMTAAELAEKIGRDPTTIYNWESGKADPDANSVYQIAEAFGDLQIWYDWMRTKFWSYAKMHPETSKYDIRGAVMSLLAETADVQDMSREMLRDGGESIVTDDDVRDKTLKEVGELLSACQRLFNVLKSKG